jgi:hypothetical protein
MGLAVKKKYFSLSVIQLGEQNIGLRCV